MIFALCVSTSQDRHASHVIELYVYKNLLFSFYIVIVKYDMSWEYCMLLQDRKREAVVVEQQRRIQEAMTAKTSTPNDMELKAMKAMGAMEEGDAVFGAGAEVNLDSQVVNFLAFSLSLRARARLRGKTGFRISLY